ncbi:sensor domain-containing phosphodiesterase [Marinobacter zhejiangensis]|uniref:Diguanylate cyclase (GGDEF) domain-containing protein n=1 Tax=Marinobacter zhejiangensis TaxID=488535 RepID=A0A1I4NE86_9GAMM|nr:sensor domain-containing phosphodiesterase [Marinobacter zhejiangensis]SFM13882.1 diguanylate cyclase (GGDEF) domain-containing protein [Marinobacter zhejiangensis]
MTDSYLFTSFHEKLMKLSHNPQFINEPRDQKLAALTELCAQALDTERVSIWKKSHGADRITCEYLHSSPQIETVIDPGGDTPPLTLHRRDHPTYFQALGLARLIDVPDARNDPRTRSFNEGYLTPLGIYSLLDAPVFDGARPSGVVCLESTTPRKWTLPELSFVVAVADTVSLINTHEAWLESKRKLDYLTHYDSLTGLANLYSLRERLGYRISRALRKGGGDFLLLWIDLDRLKVINDGLGPDIGDQVIAETGRRLSTLPINQADLLARIGGDEFALLVEDQGQELQLDDLVQTIQSLTSQPIDVHGHQLIISASIGICRYPDDGEDAESLLRNAEAAMYYAKKQGQGQGQAHRFNTSIRATARSRFAMERELRDAILRDHLSVHYQPIFDTRTKTLVGAEALVRWQHPSRGMMSPIEFLEIARSAGLMNALGESVLREVCRHIQQARKQGIELPYISVNLASEQVLDPDLPDRIAKTCQAYSVPQSTLHFEVTEDAIQGDSKLVSQNLNRIVALGSELAIDDFGTGYSSLSRLKAMPFSKLKIDRSFIRDIPNDEDDCAITLSIIGLAKGLGLSLIAEGVESVEHETWLGIHGCQYVQGFLYSKPVDFNTLISEFVATTS